MTDALGNMGSPGLAGPVGLDAADRLGRGPPHGAGVVTEAILNRMNGFSSTKRSPKFFHCVGSSSLALITSTLPDSRRRPPRTWTRNPYDGWRIDVELAKGPPPDLFGLGAK